MDALPPGRAIQPTKSVRALTLGVAAAWLLLARAEAGVSLTTLVSFNQTNGAFPSASVIQAKDGNFYGTTASYGSGSYGTIFKMSLSGTFTNLVSFNSTNGAGPRAGLVQGADGNFYGTTYNGGSNNAGTIFQLTGSGGLTTLVTLSFDDTGAYPKAGLIQGKDTNFYGTTAIGGINSGGTAFRVMTNGTLTNLVSFNISGNAGNSPYAGLVQGNDGSLYGTTYQGGTNGYGTIFKLTTNGMYTPLYSFTGAGDGANPYAGLVQGADGKFYGTTFGGGALGYGTVFKFATNGTLTTLASFGNTNGSHPQAGLVQGSDGNFYGTTVEGGTNSLGTVFQISTNGALTSLYSFTGGVDGASPWAGLIQGDDGNFYGTTHDGANGYGTVFRLSLTVPPPPSFLTVEATGGTLTLTWSATVGQIYQMLYKTNLDQNVWNNLDGQVTATNPIMMTFDAAGTDPHRFYRILVIP